MKVYALKNNQLKIRECSSSGGAFYSIAKQILLDGGIVYGAAFDEQNNVVHLSVDNIESMERLMGSKYVQSNLGNVFKDISRQLDFGKKVLFSGTPCQVAAVKRFLGKRAETDMFYTCDIICHGVPSPEVFAEYCRYIEKENNESIVKISFRNKKEFDWKDCKETIELSSSKSIVMNEWMRLFYGHEIMRQSCYKCRFTNLNRQGDITLGDFWGIERVKCEFADNKGVSLILVNSNKGMTLFKAITNETTSLEADIKDTVQPQLYKPIRKPILRGIFWRIYKKMGSNYAFRMIGNENSIYNQICEIIIHCKSSIKKVISHG